MTPRKTLPPQDVLLELLTYEPESGTLTWRERPLSRFADEHHGKVWNSRCAGKPAFVSPKPPQGYLCGSIDGEIYKAHRVIWKMVYGTEPLGIDHINGCVTDNSLRNLREADQSINSKNRSRRSDNKSGETGIFQNRSGTWSVTVSVDKRRVHVGNFATLEEAGRARANAMLAHGYHPDHGRRA